MSHIYEYAFKGSPEDVTLEPGIYTFELWGAQGGSFSGGTTGGLGGYVKGNYGIKDITSLRITVGGQNSYNGGGSSTSYDSRKGACGGGGTDIRIYGTELEHRIIVAGGGGGAWSSTINGSNGGVGKGNIGTGYALGKGEPGYVDAGYYNYYGGAGGGGYYGGYSSKSDEITDYDDKRMYSGRVSSGGTGYISPSFTDTSTKDGVRSGNGLVRITLVRHYSHKIYTTGSKLHLDKFDINTHSVTKIEIKINGELIDTINEPENNVVYNIDNTLCIFGSNIITVVTTLLLEDGTEEVNEDNIQYIRYGAQIPANADLNTFKKYLASMSTQVADLRNQLANVLTNQGIDVSGINKITDLIKLAEQLTNSNSTEITEYITRITELEAQIQELNEALNGKVDPAGTAVAGDVLSGKTFINSTGQTVTGTMANMSTHTQVTDYIAWNENRIYLGIPTGAYVNVPDTGYPEVYIEKTRLDSNLVPENIVSGKSICGVAGSAIKAPNVTAGSSYYLLRGVYVSGQHSVDYYGGYIKNGKIYSNQNYIWFRMYFPFSGTISIDYIYYFTDWYNQIKVYNKAGTLVNQTPNEQVWNANTRLSHNLQVEAGGRIDICGYGLDYGTNGADTSTPDSNYLRDLNVKFSLS